MNWNAFFVVVVVVTGLTIAIFLVGWIAEEIDYRFGGFAAGAFVMGSIILGMATAIGLAL